MREEKGKLDTSVNDTKNDEIMAKFRIEELEERLEMKAPESGGFFFEGSPW